MTTFGDLLRDHRLAAKLSQAEMAKGIKTSQKWVSLLERGQLPPSAKHIARLDALLDLSGKKRTRFLLEAYLAHVPIAGHSFVRGLIPLGVR